MNSTPRDSGTNSTSYVPQTAEEKAEAFRLLGELENELAREEAVIKHLTSD